MVSEGEAGREGGREEREGEREAEQTRAPHTHAHAHAHAHARTQERTKVVVNSFAARLLNMHKEELLARSLSPPLPP